MPPKVLLEVTPEQLKAYLAAKERRSQASARKMRLYYEDPVAFIRDCIEFPDGKGLTPYQEEVIGSIPEKKRVAQRGCHGLGKSFTSAVCILWFALTRDAAGVDWKCPVTAGAWRQLEQYLWPEVHKVARMLRWDQIGRDPFRRGEFLTLNLNLNYGSAFAVASSNPAFIEGVHADSVMYVFDESKCPDINTPVATPNGWTTMENIKVGDEVFDEMGLPTKVTYVSPIVYGRDCSLITFGDGTQLVTDNGHLWSTLPYHRRQTLGMQHKNDPRYKKTYEQIKDWREWWDTAQDVETQHLMGDGSYRSGRTAIPTCYPLQLPEADLPIGSYTLGAWLGDGNSWHPIITTMDPEILDHIHAEGYTLSPHKDDPTSLCQNYGIGGLHAQLREANLLCNKHIPPVYLRASYSQRLELLRGLMDTDGSTMTERGKTDSRVCFTSVKENLANEVAELVRTFGWKVNITKDRAMLNGIDIGPCYNLRWSADVCLFHAERKAMRWVPRAAQASTSTIRSVVSVEPIESRPVRCISVESPRHLYLLGENFIPTHNSISDATFDAAEGAFSGATEGREAFALASSTPGPPSGRFYNIHMHKEGFEDWHTRHVKLEEAIAAGRVDPDWVEQKKKQWGADSGLFANRVLGEFHQDDEDTVIPLAWIEAAQQRWDDHDFRTDPLAPLDRIGVDVARTGKDRTVIAPIHGWRVEKLLYFDQNSTTKTEREVMIVAGESEAVITVDCDGVGAGVYDHVKQMVGTQRARPFHAAAATDWQDATKQLEFANCRASAWWSLRQMLNPDNDPTLELPPDDQLSADLCAPKRKETARGKILVESKDDVKKRLEGRSTDAADSVIMPLFNHRKKRRRRMGNMGFTGSSADREDNLAV
jgi:hypothetical protein